MNNSIVENSTHLSVTSQLQMQILTVNRPIGSIHSEHQRWNKWAHSHWASVLLSAIDSFDVYHHLM